MVELASVGSYFNRCWKFKKKKKKVDSFQFTN